MVQLLACECSSCVDWEIVKMADGTIHLYCKSCDRTDELDNFKIHEKPGNQVSWVVRDKE